MIFLFCCGTAYSQQFPNIQFNNLTEKEGLSNNEITCITQDEDGFIWISTPDGLNRFDGYRVRRFYHNLSNENSLVNNAVYRVIPGGKDHLWISTREGLSVYNKKTGVFKNFRHDPTDITSLDNDQFSGIYSTKNNSAWITTGSSLYYIDSLYNYKKIPTEIDLKNIDKKKYRSYEKLTEDRQGNLWAFKLDYLFLIDKKTMQVSKVFGPFEGNIEIIYQDSDLQYWIGSFGGGLMKFDPINGKAAAIKLANGTFVIHTITDWWDQHHTRWLVAGSDRGLLLIDPISLKSKEYIFHLGYFPQQIVSHNEVQYVFVDRQNILWVATEGGVYYAKPSRQLFDLWNLSASDRVLPTAVFDWVYSLCEVKDGYWISRWIDSGLYYFNKEGVLSKTITTIKTTKGSLLLTDSLKPYYLFPEGDSILWFTTNEFLVHYDLQTNKALLYKPPDNIPFTGLRTILPIDDHSWWIRTRNNGPNGIYVFDPTTRKFTKHFTTGCSNCVPPGLLTIYRSSKNEIYITAVGEGLFKYDPLKDNFIPVFKFEGKDLKKHSNSFECVAEDKSGLLWIASYMGVFEFDPQSKKIEKDYTDNELLGGVEVSRIVLDEQQNLWLDTQRGIFYILHSTGQVHELTNTQGLRNNSNGIFQMGKDHAIYDGIQGFIVRINPSELLNHPDQKIPVHFSEATVMDAPYYFRFTSSGQKEMITTPGQNRFSLDFSVMNYDGDNHYYYKLDGVMNDWQQNENGHLAFYNLSPGKYTLHVKGTDQYGNLPGNEDDVAIIVEPHWWQTNWFKLLCIAFIISLATFLIQRRIIQIRNEADFKQKIAETEMMALRSQMNPHFIFNSLNSIENFMMQNEKRLASSYLNKFARLIRSILDSSRTELVPLAKDIEALRLYVDLEQLRFNHKFSFDLHVDPILLNGDYKVPAMLIQPYVENAIVHGLAHSERDNLALTVYISLQEEYIHYSILDNGVGRQLAAQYNQQNKPRHKSVGLSISEERIHIFNQKQNAHGKVSITDLYDENKQPSGTKVEISIKAA